MSDALLDAVDKPTRKRKRAAISCELCRKRKLRCDREEPCGNCIKSRNPNCVYEARVPSGPSGFSSPNAGGQLSGQSPRYFFTAPGRQDEPMVWRPINRDNDHAQGTLTSLVSTPASKIKTTESRLGGTFHIHHDAPVSDHSHPISSSVMHKSRLYGQSHWMNGVSLFQDIIHMLEPGLREDSPKVLSGMQRCKSLAKVIKSNREPPWPAWPSLQSSDMPSPDIMTTLLEGYLRTSERIYRVLHVPTFRRLYQSFLDDEPTTAEFHIQMRLVCAIGATVHDDAFTLRGSAIRWIYEAQSWLSRPCLKPRQSVASLQIQILLVLARDLVGVGEDMAWTLSGSLLRTAMQMGLHREPSKSAGGSALSAELHRRLWNTVLEISLQTSMASGGPPLIALEDFDTNPPINIDDAQLELHQVQAEREDIFTSTSIARAFRSTYGVRLAIAKSLNGIKASTISTTLQLDTDLRAAHRRIRTALQAHQDRGTRGPSAFEMRMVDYIMQRYLAALHVPFFGPSLHDSALAFSRRVINETSLQLWCAASAPSSLSQQFNQNADLRSIDFERVCICGSGFFRTVAFQSSFLIAAECRARAQEEQGLGPVPFQPNLYSVVEDAKSWYLKCIQAGETNVKGYLLLSLLSAQISGLKQGASTEKLPLLLSQAAEDALDHCSSVLSTLAGLDQPNGLHKPDDSIGAQSSDPGDVLSDWDFLMSDSFFDFAIM